MVIDAVSLDIILFGIRCISAQPPGTVGRILVVPENNRGGCSYAAGKGKAVIAHFTIGIVRAALIPLRSLYHHLAFTCFARLYGFTPLDIPCVGF